MRLIGDMLTPRSRIRASIVAFVTALTLLIAGPAVAAPAAPDEGDNKSLRAALEAAAKGHIEAKAKYDRAKKRQLELGLELKKLEDRLAELHAEIAIVADHSYRAGRLSAVTMLLNSGSPDDFIERMIGLETIMRRDNRQLQMLTEAREQAGRRRRRSTRGQGSRRSSSRSWRRRSRRPSGRSPRSAARRRRFHQRQLAAREAGAAQPRRLVAARVLHGERPDHLGLHHPTHPARAAAGHRPPASSGYVVLLPQRRAPASTRRAGPATSPRRRTASRTSHATGGDRRTATAWPRYFVKQRRPARRAVRDLVPADLDAGHRAGGRTAAAAAPAADHTNHVHLSVY